MAIVLLVMYSFIQGLGLVLTPSKASPLSDPGIQRTIVGAPSPVSVSITGVQSNVWLAGRDRDDVDNRLLVKYQSGQPVASTFCSGGLSSFDIQTVLYNGNSYMRVFHPASNTFLTKRLYGPSAQFLPENQTSQPSIVSPEYQLWIKKPLPPQSRENEFFLEFFKEPGWCLSFVPDRALGQPLQGSPIPDSRSQSVSMEIIPSTDPRRQNVPGCS